MPCPLIYAAFLGPYLHTERDHGGGRQEQRNDGRNPQHQVRSALFGRGADPGDPDDQQNLHLHQVAETKFLLQHMARRSGQGRVDGDFLGVYLREQRQTSTEGGAGQF